MTEHVTLPLILNGEIIRDAAAETGQVLRYEGGLEVEAPIVTDAHLARIVAAGPGIDAELGCLTTQQLAWALMEVGRRWDARQTEGRKLADEYVARLTGLPAAMVQNDLQFMSWELQSPGAIFDLFGAELGHERIMDEWIPVQHTYHRAYPRGLALHYLVGNLPIASMYSMFRAIITRNRSLAKLPVRDPVSATALAMSFAEVLPGHPLTRALSVGYWGRGERDVERTVRIADTVAVWGSNAALAAVKRHVPPGVPVAEWGPKRSASIVDLTAADPAVAAWRCAEDFCYYDQEACFNTQRLFVCGDVDSFVSSYLPEYVRRFTERLPPPMTNRDVSAHRSQFLLDARYRGFRVDDHTTWASVVVDDPAQIVDHPLARTLIIHPVESPAEALPWLDGETQTVGLLPYALAETLRDGIARRGVSRIVEAGYHRLPRTGFSHDGNFGLRPMVRYVSIERPRDEFDRSSQEFDRVAREHAIFLGSRSAVRSW